MRDGLESSVLFECSFGRQIVLCVAPIPVCISAGSGVLLCSYGVVQGLGGLLSIFGHSKVLYCNYCFCTKIRTPILSS